MSAPSTPSNNKEPRRRPWIWLGLIGLVIVAAVLAAVVLLPHNGSSAEATEADPLNLADVVITDLTQEETFNGKLESIKGSGTLIPASQIELSFASPGTVAELLVQVGQEVQAGDVLALVQLDSNHDQTLPAGLNAEFNVAGLSNRIVRVFLPLDDEGLLAVGDPVTVELPDLSEIPGTVVFVPQTPTPSNYGPPSFEVLVEIDDPTAAAGLAELPDETSVDVIFISDAVDDVMAIPVSALVALLEGGYAVEVDTAIGGPRLVAVEIGFFGSNNMIAVTSDALQPGDQVVVP